MPKKDQLRPEKKRLSRQLPRIGIDCRLAGIDHAGIGRYISSFVPRVISLLHQQAEIVLFCTNQKQASLLNPTHQSRVKVVITSIKHYSFAEQLQFLLLLQKQHLDLLHVPHFNVPLFYRGRLVTTIHDLLWHKQRGLQVTTLNPVLYWLKYFFYTRVVARTVAHAKKIFVPSSTIANELEQMYPETRKKILVTYEGVGDSLCRNTSINLPRKKNTLLYVGSLYPHKNVEIVFKLLQQKSELLLEIVTARSIFVSRIKKRISELNIESQVKFYLAISDQKLIKHYKQATAVIQPSVSEGFGLTGLEALSQGTPVIASDIAIFHEIYQSYASFFSPRDISSLVKAWDKLKKTNRTIKLSQNFINRYSWDTLAKLTTHAYLKELNH